MGLTLGPKAAQTCTDKKFMFLETQATDLPPCFFLGFGEYCGSSFSYFYCLYTLYCFHLVLLQLELQGNG